MFRILATIAAALILFAVAEAGSKHRRGSCANGSCASGACQPAQAATVTETKSQDKSKTAVVTEAATCANGTCSTSTKSSRRHR